VQGGLRQQSRFKIQNSRNSRAEKVDGHGQRISERGFFLSAGVTVALHGSTWWIELPAARFRLITHNSSGGTVLEESPWSEMD
jgi:hypothetical protein